MQQEKIKKLADELYKLMTTNYNGKEELEKSFVQERKIFEEIQFLKSSK